MHIPRRLLAVTVPIALVLAGCASVIDGQALLDPDAVSTSTSTSTSASTSTSTSDPTSESDASSSDGPTPPDPTSSDPGAGTGPIAGEIPRPTPGGGGAGAIPAGLEEFYNQQLDWQACPPFNVNPDYDEAFADDSLECANLILPLDYGAPSGPTVSMAVMRAPATGDDPVGSLQVNPGGPGGSGLEFVANSSTSKDWAPLRESFDLIGFDTRGVGASRPAISCQTDAEKDAVRAENLRSTTEAGVQARIDQVTEYVQQCQERTGDDAGIDGTSFLLSLGSDTTAKDMDVLRSVLGDEKLTFVGYSYGTFLAELYGLQFPSNVRAMVLDGVVDPSDDPKQGLIETYTSFQETFVAYATACAATPTCPVGTDPAQATATFQAITRPLLDNPLELPDGRILTYDDAMTGTLVSLYSPTFWPYLDQALTQLLVGDGTVLMYLADFYLERDSTGHYSVIQDVLNAVHCMDDPRPSADPAEQIAFVEQLNAAAPWRDSGDPVVAVPDACALWPGEPTAFHGTLDIPDLPPVVVISTTGDPATPYESGVSVADQLKATLITYEGDQHTAYLSAGNSCVDDATTAYLVDLTLPGQITCS